MRSFTPYGTVSNKANTWLYRSWSLSWLGVDMLTDTLSSKKMNELPKPVESFLQAVTMAKVLALLNVQSFCISN